MENTDAKKSMTIWLGLGAIIVFALIFWMASRGADEGVPIEGGEGTDVEEAVITEDAFYP
jgi:membrane protein involved in colicin uptake